MPSGGARSRSGPQADPNSRTSERKRAAAKNAVAKKTGDVAHAVELPVTVTDFNPQALPARGRTGRAPAFPLAVSPRESEQQTKRCRTGELELWREIWKLPQAVAWEREPYRWRRIALYCRLTISVETQADPAAALVSRQRELAIEHGLTPDGLRQNGWAIAPDQLAEKRATKKTAPAKAASAPVRRLRG